MSTYIVLPMENGRRYYLNTQQIRGVLDQKDEDSVVIEFDQDHKLYVGRERAAPLLRWLKGEVAQQSS